MFYKRLLVFVLGKL